MEDNKQYDKVKEIYLAHEMKTSFLNYAMSVIVARALPDVRDGLKPVHRRIIYGMNGLNMGPNSAYKKSARLVGDVMGKYHPHGDSSIYEATVRMAQSFSYRYPLVNGHGNFGSIDGDGAAAMRYTEVKMEKITMELLRDINKNTVDFVDNYDGSEKEPAVLPARFPNFLVNGASGIAVGMATNVPPHNLGEVIDGAIALLKDPTITVLDLMDYIKAPDFPTGGEILGLGGLKQAYETGKGLITIRSKCDIEEMANGKSMIIVREIPYQVNKSKLIDKIAQLAKEKKVEGITDLRDESNRNGIRIVIELRRDVSPEIILNNLFKYSQLQTTFGINMIALVDQKPKVLSLKESLQCYLDFQNEVIVKRTRFNLQKSEDREHIVKGLLVALVNIDEVVDIIKKASTDQEASETLMTTYDLDEIQAKSILDMRLRRLTSLEVSKLESEQDSLLADIEYNNSILASKEKQNEILITELTEIKDKYADERRSIVNYVDSLDIEDEDLVPVEDIIVSLTHNGYCKRSGLDDFRTQNRGGRGVTSQKTFEDDFVETIVYASTHDDIAFFTNKGKVYKVKGYQIQRGSRHSKGLPLVNIINIESDERVTAVLSIGKDVENKNLVFFTKNGVVKRTRLEEYKNIRSNGLIAINLKENDELLSVKLTDGNSYLLMATNKGKALRFSESDARLMGRATSGVRGIRLDNSFVVGAAVSSSDEDSILAVTENGYGKRTNISEYRPQSRGGKGSKTIEITDKNGELVSLRSITDEDDVMIVTDNGIIIRIDAKQISTFKKATQGVHLIRLQEGQKVSTVCVVPKEGEE